MGFFKKLLGGQPAVQDDIRPRPTGLQDIRRVQVPWPAPDPSRRVAVTALFSQLPATLDHVLPELQRLRPQTGPVTLGPAAVAHTTVHIGEHVLGLDQRNQPLTPEAQQQTIHLSHWDDALKAPLYSHRAHMVLSYQGGAASVAEQLCLLYALATALQPLGLADETACTALPGPLLPQLFTPESLSECERILPTMLCCGVLKYELPDHSVYYVSRGFERFGFSNLAYRAPAGSGNTVMELFDTLLNYQWSSKTPLGPGHTSENSTQFMQFFDPPEEYAAALSGGFPVLDLAVWQK